MKPALTTSAKPDDAPRCGGRPSSRWRGRTGRRAAARKAPTRFLPSAVLMPVLPPTAASTMPSTVVGTCTTVDAAQPGRGDEAGEVGGRAAAEAHDDVGAREVRLAQHLPAERGDLGALGALGVGHLGGRAPRSVPARSARRRLGLRRERRRVDRRATFAALAPIRLPARRGADGPPATVGRPDLALPPTGIGVTCFRSCVSFHADCSSASRRRARRRRAAVDVVRRARGELLVDAGGARRRSAASARSRIAARAAGGRLRPVALDGLPRRRRIRAGRRPRGPAELRARVGVEDRAAAEGETTPSARRARCGTAALLEGAGSAGSPCSTKMSAIGPCSARRPSSSVSQKRDAERRARASARRWSCRPPSGRPGRPAARLMPGSAPTPCAARRGWRRGSRRGCGGSRRRCRRRTSPSTASASTRATIASATTPAAGTAHTSERWWCAGGAPRRWRRPRCAGRAARSRSASSPARTRSSVAGGHAALGAARAVGCAGGCRRASIDDLVVRRGAGHAGWSRSRRRPRRP